MSQPAGGSSSSSYSGLSSLGTGTFNQANNLIQGLIGLSAPSSAFNLTGQGSNALNQGISSLLSNGQSAQNYISQILNGSTLDPSKNPATAPTLSLYNQNYTTGLNQGVDSLNALFQNAGQGNSGVEAQLGTNLARGALEDYQNNIGSFLGGLYNTNVGQQQNALSSSGMPGQLALQALTASQIPGQLQNQQFLENLQVAGIPISDLMSLTGEGTYSTSASSKEGISPWQQFLGSGASQAGQDFGDLTGDVGAAGLMALFG